MRTLAEGAGFDALAAAHSRALAQVSGEIAPAILCGRRGSLSAIVAGIRAALHARRHTALLVAIVVMIAIRPLIGDAGDAPVLFSLALLTVMLIALFIVQVDERSGESADFGPGRARWPIVGWVLAALAVAERIAVFMVPSPQLLLVATICWLLFFAFVSWTQLRGVLHHRVVTSETIAMSISVYLLLGLSWGLLYVVLFLLDPGSFNLGAHAPGNADPVKDWGHIFPTFLYFSLTTISTIGFGDITPLTLRARYAAVAEGITAQFYLAILVARLVGMHMSRPAEPGEHNVRRDPPTE